MWLMQGLLNELSHSVSTALMNFGEVKAKGGTRGGDWLFPLFVRPP